MRLHRQVAKLGVAGGFIAVVGLAAAQEPAVDVSGEIPELPPIEDLSVTVERPLFMPSRRPPAAPPPAPVAKPTPVEVPAEESPADLTGIVNGPDWRYAILTNRATKEVHHLRKGEKIEDWSVQEIGPRYVVLRRGPGSLRLELFAEGEAGPGANDGERELERPPRNLRPRSIPRLEQQRRRLQRARRRVPNRVDGQD